VLLIATATGCSGGEPPARACTGIGSPAGVSVTIVREAAIARPRLTLRICQTECLSRDVELQPGSTTVGATCVSDDPDGSCSASASPDGSLVGFVDVPTLTAGDVRVSGQLRTVTASRELDEVTVSAAATYPNGQDCPAGGPQAAVRVTKSGLQ
jgi:hypothetical protein